MVSGAIWVGTANWTDHEQFYPKGLPPADRLAYYAERFPVVEVNASFYRPFPPAQYARWAARTPAGFGFLVKVYRSLSWHLKDEPPTAAHFDAHRRAVEPPQADGKFLGFLFQFPPWHRQSDRNRAYVAAIREGFPNERVGVEFRHPSWFAGDAREQTLELLRSQRLANAIPDEPRADATGLVPTIAEVTDPATVYYRFQGRDTLGRASYQQRHELRERHVYGDAELRELADLIVRLHTGTAASFVLFHNNAGNNAVTAARRMIDELAARHAPVRRGGRGCSGARTRARASAAGVALAGCQRPGR